MSNEGMSTPSEDDSLNVTGLEEALQTLRDIEIPDENIHHGDLSNNGSVPTEKVSLLGSADSGSSGIEIPDAKESSTGADITVETQTIYTQETLPYNNTDSASPIDIIKGGGVATMIFDQNPAEQELSTATVAIGIDPDSPEGEQLYTFTVTELSDGASERLGEILNKSGADGYDANESPLGQSFSVSGNDLDTGIYSNFMNAESVVFLAGDMNDNQAQLDEVAQDQSTSNDYLSNPDAPEIQASNADMSIKP